MREKIRAFTANVDIRASRTLEPVPSARVSPHVHTARVVRSLPVVFAPRSFVERSTQTLHAVPRGGSAPSAAPLALLAPWRLNSLSYRVAAASQCAVRARVIGGAEHSRGAR